MNHVNKAAGTAAPTQSAVLTSSLPFAARTCDVPYLDAAVGGERLAIDNMVKHGAGEAETRFAEATNLHAVKLTGWVDVLKSVEDHLKWAHRGGSPDGVSAGVCFSRARCMLDLAVGQIELMALDAALELEQFCNQMADAAPARNGGAA